MGKVLDGNRCVEVSQCTCVHMGRHFPPGSTISQDCNTWWDSRNTHKCTDTEIYRPHKLDCVFPPACAVTVPGNAVMKAALVREMPLFYLWNKVLVCSFLADCLCCLYAGECLVVGQSHIKSFDNKFFTFTGHCQYLLARDCSKSSFSVIIENVQVIFEITALFLQLSIS